MTQAFFTDYDRIVGQNLNARLFALFKSNHRGGSVLIILLQQPFYSLPFGARSCRNDICTGFSSVALSKYSTWRYFWVCAHWFRISGAKFSTQQFNSIHLLDSYGSHVFTTAGGFVSDVTWRAHHLKLCSFTTFRSSCSWYFFPLLQFFIFFKKQFD